MLISTSQNKSNLKLSILSILTNFWNRLYNPYPSLEVSAINRIGSFLTPFRIFIKKYVHSRLACRKNIDRKNGYFASERASFQVYFDGPFDPQMICSRNINLLLF